MEGTGVAKEFGKNKIPIHKEGFKFYTMMLEDLKLGNEVVMDIEDKSKKGLRQHFDRIAKACMKPREYKGRMEDRKIPSPYDPDGIVVRIYTPDVVAEDPVIMVYFHGGAQVSGDIKYSTSMHKCLSILHGCIIVDVNYRLCPEHPLPAGLEDCAVATQWVMDNKLLLGGSEKSAVGVSGDSAGAQCTIYVAHHVKGLDFQILVYPWTDMTGNSPSLDEFDKGILGDKDYLLTLAKELVHAANGDLEDPIWSPVYNTHFDNVPPTLVILAQIDTLRDDGRRYSKLLIDAGVPVTVYEVKGAIHIFYTFPDFFEELTEDAYAKVGEFLKWIKLMKK